MADAGNGDFSINAQAGIVTVFANQRQHKAVSRYLRKVLESADRQVLIEAKILEVVGQRVPHRHQLVDGAWTFHGRRRGAAGWHQIISDFTRDITSSTISDPTISCVISNKRNTLNLAAQLVNQFGTVRTLSDPRLTVVNNQVAMLRVASNQVFSSSRSIRLPPPPLPPR